MRFHNRTRPIVTRAILPALAAFGIAMTPGLPAQSNESRLPPGPAKDLTVKLCVGCHEIDLVVARRHTRAEWEGVIEDMIARGTKGSAQELAAVVDYLNQHLGRVNVNAATAKELETGLEIPERDAQAIVSWREQHGNFKTFEEVRKAPGLDAATIAEKRGWMSFE
jgi:competence protein ComEA